MGAFSVADAAAALLGARRSGRPVPIPAIGPADMDEAFAVQAKVAEALGPVAAWKAGRGGNAAPFAADHTRPSPCRWRAADFLRPAVEAEIAFLIVRDVGPAPSQDELRAAIGSIHAAIEIADSRFDTWPVPDRLWALADHQGGGGLVVDPNGVAWTGASLERARVELAIDGKPAFAGEGTNPGGEPFALLGGMVARSGGLRAGTYVTTGSLSGMIPVAPGARISARIEGIGGVELELAG